MWTRLIVLVALSFGSTQAFAQASKVKKAEKFYGKYHGSDAVALAKAWDAIQDARVHPKTRDDPKTWFLYGEIARAYATNPDLDSPSKNPIMTALQAYDTAIKNGGKDLLAEPILEGVMTLEAMASTRAYEEYEDRSFDKAWASLRSVNKAHQIIRQIGRLDPGKEIESLRYATLTAIELGLLDEARESHDALVGLKGIRSATTLALSQALEEAEGAEKALEFLGPHSDADPADAALMKERFKLLTGLKNDDEIRELLVKHEALAKKAVGISLVLAEAWDALDDLGASQKSYAEALTLDGNNQDILRGYADVELRRARALNAAAEATRSYKERKKLRAERDEAHANAVKLLQTSRDLDPAHLPTLKKLHEAYEDTDLADPEEREALEQAIEELEAKEK